MFTWYMSHLVALKYQPPNTKSEVLIAAVVMATRLAPKSSQTLVKVKPHVQHSYVKKQVYGLEL